MRNRLRQSAINVNFVCATVKEAAAIEAYYCYYYCYYHVLPKGSQIACQCMLLIQVQLIVLRIGLT